MNRLIIMFSLWMFAFATQAQQTKTYVSDSTSNEDGTVTIRILTSSQCDMCKDILEKAMAYEKGVKSSELNVDTQIFTVTFNPKKTNSLKIKQAINKSGYDADDMVADERGYNNLPACCKKGGMN
jgi:mercuric ion binding protein